MNKSESIAKIADALSKFQADVQDPAKNSANPFFKSKYVELDDLLASVRPVLSKYGLAVLQEPSGDEKVSVKTIILHNSGEYIEFEPIILKPVKNDPQGVGSAITYGRRYALSSILGVAWDADDDGNKASGKEDKSSHTNVSTTPQKTVQPNNDVESPHLVSKGQVTFLSKKFKDVGLDPNTQTQIKFGKDLEQLTVEEGNQIAKELKQ